MLAGMEPVIAMTGVGWAPEGDAVLRGVSIAVAQGETRAVIGPPGSGRTSLLRVLLGLIKPDEGQARILGLDCWQDSVELHRLVSFPPVLTMWPTLTVAETLGFVHRLAGDGDPLRCRLLLHRFGIDPDTPVGALSPHERDATSLIAALCRPAQVFLVDDALTGGSGRHSAQVFAALKEARCDGATVLLTGGPEDGLERHCDSVTRIIAGHTCAKPAAVG